MVWHYDKHGKQYLFWKEAADLQFRIVRQRPCDLWGGPSNWYRFEPGIAQIAGTKAEAAELAAKTHWRDTLYVRDRLAPLVLLLNRFEPQGQPFTIQRGQKMQYPTNPEAWAAAFPDASGVAQLKPDAIVHGHMKFDLYFQKALFRTWPDYNPKLYPVYRRKRNY